MNRTERIASLFKSKRHRWISCYTLSNVGGFAGWRTRVSNCRTEMGMRIVNRQRKHAKGYTISEYKYVGRAA